MKTPTLARLFLVVHRRYFGAPKREACEALALALAHRTLDPHCNVSRLVAAAKAAIRDADAIERYPWMALSVSAETGSAGNVRRWKRMGRHERAKEASELQSFCAKQIHAWGGTQ